MTPYLYPGVVTDDMILRAVADEFGISVFELYKKTRARRCSQPRSVAIALLCRYHTPKEMSIRFNLTQASVSIAKKRVTEMEKYNKDFRKKYQSVKSKLYPHADDRIG